MTGTGGTQQSTKVKFGLTDGVGRQALRMASELECRGVYLGSWRMGCILKGCLLFIDIMIAEVREGRCPSSSFDSVLVVFYKNASERKNLPGADSLNEKSLVIGVSGAVG